MSEIPLVIRPPLSISQRRNISRTLRTKLYPYATFSSLDIYQMELSVYDNGGSVMDSLSPFMLSDRPIFFDFTSLKSELWGHLMITEISPELRHTGWNLRVVGLLIPSWGSTFGRTKNSAILNGSTYTYFLGSNSWNLTPTIDTDSQTIQWEFTAYNPLMEVDYEVNWSSAIEEKTGAGYYDWTSETTSAIDLGSQGYTVTRTTGTYANYSWTHSSDGSSYALLDLSNVPFIHLSLKNRGTLEIRLYDSDQTEYRYTTFTNIYPIQRFTQSFHKAFTWSFNANGTTETDIDYSQVSTQLIMDDTEKLELDRLGYTYGRPAIYEFRVPSYNTTSTVTIETYNPSDSTWYSLISFDPRHPEDYTPSLWNLKYNNGRSGPHIDGVKVFALYRLGGNGELVSPITYEDSKDVDLFPNIEYSNILGYSFAIGVLLGPDDDSHGWSRVKFRITYPYDDLALGEDYLGVVS